MRIPLLVALTGAAATLGAADFTVDFSAVKPACEVEHYQSNSLHRLETFAGRPALVISKADKPRVTDTCWTFRTKPFPVTPGSEFVVEVALGGDLPSAYFNPGSTIRWLDAAGRPVMTVDQRGREVPLSTWIDQPTRERQSVWTTVRTKEFVPSTAAQAQITIAEDHPNLGPKEKIAFSRVAYFEHPRGIAWRYDDMEAPEIELVTPSPTTDLASPIRFRLADKSGVDYSRLRVLIDGKDPLERLSRQGDVLTVNPPRESWKAESVHSIEVSSADLRGNEGEDVAFVAFTNRKVNHPKWTVRDDGMILRDGEPWYPLGVYNVYPCEVNGNSCDQAVKDLMAAGMDMPHTYMVRNGKGAFNAGYESLVEACAKYGAYLNAEPGKRKGPGRDEQLFDNILDGRERKAMFAWTLGDDTSGHILPKELKRTQSICRAIDPDALTLSVDGIRHACQQVPFVPYTDILAIETYPIREMEIRDDTMAVFARSLDWAWESVRIANRPGHTVMAVPQAFKGWGHWPRYPKFEEIRCFAYISIACGARGIAYYTYNKPASTGNQGVMSTPERRDNFFGLMREIAALRPSLVLRDAARQPVVKALSGPQRNVLGGESIRALLKSDGLLVAVNTAHLPVRAEIRLPDGTRLTHDFPRYGVFVERVGGVTAGWENDPEAGREFPETKVVWRFADSDPAQCRVEKRHGAEGTVEIAGGVIRVKKTNALGEIVILPQPFEQPKDFQLAFAADVEVNGTDWSRSKGMIRAFGEKESFEVSPLDIEDARWGNRCIMWELPNSKPSTTYRKYTQHVSEGVVHPAIVISGDPSESTWRNFLAEDRQAQRAAWVREVDRRNAKNRFREAQMDEAAFDAMIARDVEHTAKIATESGYSTLLVDGRKTVPLVYRGKHSLLGTSQTELFFGRQLQDQGLRVQIVDVRFGPCGGDMGFWSKEGFDLKGMVKDIKDAMRVSPESVFLLALGCTAYPEFVEVEHPEEAWVTKDGAKAIGHGSSAIKYVDKSINAGNRKWVWPSMASRKYREAIDANIRTLVAELKRQGLSKRIVGVHIFGYHDAQFTMALSDHSRPAKEEYARYCREAGHSSYNYEFFVRQLGFRAQEEFARTFKESLGKDSIAVMWWESPLRGRPASSWDLGSFLRSKWMDVIVAQPWYEHRAPAIIGGSHPPFASMHLHGKMFWDELDLRTHEIIEPFRKGPAAVPGGGMSADFNEWQTMFRKLTGVMIAHHMGNWFYEKVGGGYSTPAISADIGEEYRLQEKVMAQPIRKWRPSVAVIADEAGVWGWPEGEDFEWEHVERGYFDQLPLLEASGVPFDIYLLEDVLRQPEILNAYKLAVFAHLRVIDEPRQNLLAALRRRGLTLAFLSGAGEVRGAWALKEKPYPELGLSAAEFNRLTREAGGYVPMTANAAQVEMNGNFISLHALKNGDFDFTLPFAAEVTNLKSGQPEKVVDGKIKLSLTAGETCRFMLKK